MTHAMGQVKRLELQARPASTSERKMRGEISPKQLSREVSYEGREEAPWLFGGIEHAKALRQEIFLLEEKPGCQCGWSR